MAIILLILQQCMNKCRYDYQWRNYTGDDGGSRLRVPLERGRRVLTAIFLFCLITKFCHGLKKNPKRILIFISYVTYSVPSTTLKAKAEA